MKTPKDPATLQTASGYPKLKTMGTKLDFCARETEVLRTLAKKVAEISARPAMAQKAKLWKAHNDLETDTPLVFIDPENGWNEIIPAGRLLCEDPLARVWEMALRKLIFWADELKDDRVIEAVFDVPYSYSDTGWGLTLGRVGGENGGSFAVKQALTDYEKDFNKIHHPEIVLDGPESEHVLALAKDVFGGILQVRRKAIWWWSLGLTRDYIDMRGLEDFMVDMLAAPEWVRRMMNLLCEGKLAMLAFLEQNGLLPDNTGATYVGSGGFGFTDELPQPGFNPKHVRTMDMWGFCESQEMVSCSPDMYAEYVFPYHKRILERFGLNCFGCCEGYDNRWHIVKQLPRLRRVSVSAWSDWRTVPEMLGKAYIASIKPSPVYLANPSMNEALVRADARRGVEQTKGGICEFIMKDNHTLGGNPRNAVRWVEIMREEIARVYG